MTDSEGIDAVARAQLRAFYEFRSDGDAKVGGDLLDALDGADARIASLEAGREVERTMIRNAVTEIARLQAKVDAVEELRDRWRYATLGSGRPSVVARAFSDELSIALASGADTVS